MRRPTGKLVEQNGHLVEEQVLLRERQRELGRKLELNPYGVPGRVELDSTRTKLVWRVGHEDRSYNYALPSEELLNRFIRLAIASPEKILAFARRWGMLRICRHGVPASHNQPVGWLPTANYFSPVPLCGPVPLLAPPDPHIYGAAAKKQFIEGDLFSESIEDWRAFARLARSMLRVAEQLHNEKIGDRADWFFVTLPPISTREEEESLIDFGRRQLGENVQHWLYLGGIGPTFYWEGGVSPAFRLDPQGLFGVLAMQLALTISRTDGFYSCSACGQVYTPSRKPRLGEPHYCPDCGYDGKVAAKLRQRLRRQRQREAAGAPVGRVDSSAER